MLLNITVIIIITCILDNIQYSITQYSMGFDDEIIINITQY